MTNKTRDGKGRFDRDPDTAARDAEAARLRARSMTYNQIAETLGMSRAAAHEAVKRALADTLTEPAEAVRRLELDKLDALERRYLDIVERRHAVLHKGEDTGYDDDGPTLKALAGLLRVSESRRKLLGLDLPVKSQVDVTVTERSAADVALDELVAEMERRAKAVEEPQST
jgi:DNA-binding Lrp family transcriptional regulator